MSAAPVLSNGKDWWRSIIGQHLANLSAGLEHFVGGFMDVTTLVDVRSEQEREAISLEIIFAHC